ncbi:Protein priA [Psilocybe cubensis]|uniref:Protein CPL1-like domain-containing protein n=2 Tax=Psilocybe cubensis TaxID=181762 RepID=A0A8H7Y389_PSICU|nr:Protein priA [Psilocybe cubensis]KAH9485364.1 Protein priA [Psilocybe cubensis]
MLPKGLYGILSLMALIIQSLGTEVGMSSGNGDKEGKTTDEPTKTFPDIQPRNGNSRCSPGTWSSKGTTPCNDCSPGSYSKESGVTSCLLARAGYYVPTPRATTETPCQSGTYSTSTGSTSCGSCPPGHMCPNNALANPQKCSPGRYSTGGLTECTKCSAGTFNSIQGATGCCPCAAGWYNDQPGNTNCQRCSNQYPYSGPGTGNRNGCSANPGGWAISPSCSQGSDGTCPGSSPFASVSSKPKRHVIHAPLCRRTGQKACPVYGFNWRGGKHHSFTSYECVDIENDLESCGGCVQQSNDGEASADGGRDCSAIPNVSTVRCHKSECVIDSCQAGFIRSADGTHCVPDL